MDLVIFDCDGVLVDSEPIGIDVDLAVLAGFGIAMSRDDAVDQFVGRSPDVLVAAIEAHIRATLPDEWLAGYRRLRREAFDAGLTVVDGIVEALDKLALPSCVASSSSHDSLEHKLRMAGMHERFAGRVFSGEDVQHGKPAPDLFLYAAEQMGACPSRCVVVEDSRVGIVAARAAGMRALAYAGGVTPPAQLAGPGTTVFDCMKELPGLLTRAAA